MEPTTPMSKGPLTPGSLELLSRSPLPVGAILTFSTALIEVKAGQRIARSGWNGKNMWIALQVPDANSKMTLPYLYFEYPMGHPAYPDGSRVPWLASQTDLLAEDWMVVQ